jgi:hypothetical protein
MASIRKWLTTHALMFFVLAICAAALMISLKRSRDRRDKHSFSRSSAKGHSDIPLREMITASRDIPSVLGQPATLAPLITSDTPPPHTPPPPVAIRASRVPVMQALARVLEEDWTAEDRAAGSGECYDIISFPA